MKLGAFSVSLSVKDLTASKEFYERIGFVVFAGDISQQYVIMKNDNTLIGLFEGMFEDNILTFNPGWDQSSNTLEDYSDIRELYRTIKDKGILIEQESIDGDTGPGTFIMTDPDGNTILIDQHI